MGRNFSRQVCEALSEDKIAWDVFGHVPAHVKSSSDEMGAVQSEPP